MTPERQDLAAALVRLRNVRYFPATTEARADIVSVWLDFNLTKEQLEALVTTIIHGWEEWHGNAKMIDLIQTWILPRAKAATSQADAPPDYSQIDPRYLQWAREEFPTHKEDDIQFFAYYMEQEDKTNNFERFAEPVCDTAPAHCDSTPPGQAADRPDRQPRHRHPAAPKASDTRPARN